MVRMQASQPLDIGNRRLPIIPKGCRFRQAERGERAVGILGQLLAELGLGGLGVPQVKQSCAQVRVDLGLSRCSTKQTEESPRCTQVVSLVQQFFSSQFLADNALGKLLREVPQDLCR